jgi:hypothetical protein
MSSAIARQNIYKNSRQILFLIYWNDAGAFESPKGITRDSKVQSRF